MPNDRDRRLAQHIERWFRQYGRAFPWRCRTDESTSGRPRRDPYVTLVSELMLQQTQAARVAERLPGFLDRFPTVRSLARATEQEVLAQWSGLGYYRRAQQLHRAAGLIVTDHGGRMPRTIEQLERLPGVGRYTAGAIASFSFGAAVPAVDGNAERVLLRLEGQVVDRKAGARSRWARDRSSALLAASASPATLNEGLIELGAVVCRARNPRCDSCPVRRCCRARRMGVAGEIPGPRRAAVREVVHHCAVLVRDRSRRILVEQRPERGLWARLWQAPTVERADRPSRREELARVLGLEREPVREGGFDHLTSHRLVRFRVWRASVADGCDPLRGQFMSRRRLEALPLASPHRRVLMGEAG